MSAFYGWREFGVQQDSYKIFRAITGFEITFPNTLAIGDYLLTQVKGTELQKITLTGATAAAVSADINSQAQGIRADVTLAGNILVRAASVDDPFFRTLSSPVLTKLSMSPASYRPRENFVLVGTLPGTPMTFEYGDTELDYSFTDQDGSQELDWYYHTSILGSEESAPSIATTALPQSGMCVIQGQLKIKAGRNVVVSAKLEIPPKLDANSLWIDKEATKTITDSQGRFAIQVPRSNLTLFQIDAIGYNEVIFVPDEPFALLKDLQPVNDHLFTEYGDPI
jgi:hypothetical protein